jgi:HAD superfamily hydrolase (TIGR01509 family)
METIGTSEHEFDPRGYLQALVGEALDWEVLQRGRIAHRDSIIHAQEILPGVREYIAEARELGLKLAVASSSSRRWVLGHLERLGIQEPWDAVLCQEDVARTKPDPALYLAAVAALGVEPAEAIAFEDSFNGVLAAEAAGLWCVAVPGALTREMDFSRADVVVGSLSELSLTELLERLGRRAGPGEREG